MKVHIDNLALKDYLYEDIKNMINAGELPAGAKINKLELAKRFNVSQTPINDALNRLVGEKYIYLEPRKGFFVRNYTYEELVLLYELRAGLEAIAAMLCCERATDEEIAILSNAFTDFSFPLTDEEYKRYSATDKIFHSQLIEFARNAYISDTLNTTGFLAKSNVAGLIRTPEETYPEHLAMQKAFSERDGKVAQQLLTKHHLLQLEFFGILYYNLFQKYI